MLPLVHLPLGPWHVAVSTYALALLGAFGAGVVVFRGRYPGVPSPAVVGGVVALGVILGARVVALLLHGSAGEGWASGGLSSAGAIVGGLAAAGAVAYAFRTPLWDLLDALVPAGLVAFVIGRIGCFFAGCCYGRPTTLPWGVVMPELGAPARHPVQLYEAAGDLLIATLAMCARRPGAAARRAAVGYAVLRAGLEYVRESAATDLVAGGRISLAPAAALVLAAAAVCPCTLRGLRLWLARTEEPREWPTRS